MAQPNVQREPSMEEILASIRQIIESNEPGASRGISATLPPVYGATEDEAADIHLTIDEDYASGDEGSPTGQIDPRFVAANSSGSMPEPEMPARALSLADVAARVRAASERQAPAPREVPAIFRQPEPRSEPQPQVPLAEEQVRLFEPNPAPAPVATPAPRVQQASERGASQPLSQPQSEPNLPQMSQPLAAMLAQPAEAPVAALEEAHQEPGNHGTEPQALAPSETRSLISETAGQQIARSFEALAEAMDGADRRSLSEVAEELLRPMLREWLDDNLPTMVERLVREEIERVARGTRR